MDAPAIIGTLLVAAESGTEFSTRVSACAHRAALHARTISEVKAAEYLLVRSSCQMARIRNGGIGGRGIGTDTTLKQTGIAVPLP